MSRLSFVLFIVGSFFSASKASYELNQPRSPFSPFTSPLEGNGLNARSESAVDREAQEIAALAAAIPGGGVPGEDYPILASVPETDFTCDEKLPGYYADTAEEAGCQVFHICQADGREDPFLCPNGSIFNQQFFVCDWWFNFDCASAEEFFNLNGEIGKVPSDDNAEINGEDGFGSKTNGYGNNNGNSNNGYGNGNNGYNNGGPPSSSYGVPAENVNNNLRSEFDDVQKPSGLYQTPI